MFRRGATFLHSVFLEISPINGCFCVKLFFSSGLTKGQNRATNCVCKPENSTVAVGRFLRAQSCEVGKYKGVYDEEMAEKNMYVYRIG